MLGRWILVVLFGCRGVAALAYLAWVAWTHPFALLHNWLCLIHLLDATFYLASAAWLFFSPSVRRLFPCPGLAELDSRQEVE